MFIIPILSGLVVFLGMIFVVSLLEAYQYLSELRTYNVISIKDLHKLLILFLILSVCTWIIVKILTYMSSLI